MPDHFNSEVLLLTALRKGDENALTHLFNQYSSKVFFYSFRYLKSKDLADEIVQLTFLRIWKSREAIDPSLPFQSFLFQVAKNLILDFFRKEIREKAGYKNIAARMQSFHNSTEDDILYDELTAISKQAISKMPDRQKLVYELSRDEGLSYEQIAERLGISINTVKVHMSNSLQTIRQYLRENTDLSHLCVLIFITLG